MPAARKQVDWPAVEADYRAGIKSQRQIAGEHGISHAAVQKRADQMGWDRDLGARIRKRAEAKVAKIAVARAVAEASGVATEAQIVESNADIQASITLSHRADVRRAREVAAAMLEELAALTLGADKIAALAELAALESCSDGTPSQVAKRVEALLEAAGLPSRAGTLSKISSSLVALVTLERRVAGIEDDAARDTDVVSALKRLAATSA